MILGEGKISVKGVVVLHALRMALFTEVCQRGTHVAKSYLCSLVVSAMVTRLSIVRRMDLKHFATYRPESSVREGDMVSIGRRYLTPILTYSRCIAATLTDSTAATAANSSATRSTSILDASATAERVRAEKKTKVNRYARDRRCQGQMSQLLVIPG